MQIPFYIIIGEMCVHVNEPRGQHWEKKEKRLKAAARMQIM